MLIKCIHIGLIACLMTLVACAHYPDVRPGASEHKVVAAHESEPESYQYAMSQAKDFCDDVHNGKRPIISNEETKFTGEDRDAYEKARLIKGIAGSVSNFTGGALQKTGRAVGAADIGKPYQTTLIFKCQ